MARLPHPKKEYEKWLHQGSTLVIKSMGTNNA